MRTFTMLGMLMAAALGACGDDPAGDPPPGEVEDCARAGDEDGNGLADCADPACSAAPACAPVCGNGVLEPGEACDDGNTTGGDGCEATCQLPACGAGGGGSCACEPVAAGQGGSFVVAGEIRELVADPARCRVYALAGGLPSAVVVLDARERREIARIPLFHRATDLDLSPGGEYLVASHEVAASLSLIDPDARSVSSIVPAAGDPAVVEVDAAGNAYYLGASSFSASIRRLTLGGAVDEALGTTPWQGDLELSANGVFLYAGATGNGYDAKLYKYNVSGGGLTLVDQSTASDGYGSPSAPRRVYVGPSGRRVYHGDRQHDAESLDRVLGRTGEAIYAEDAAGTFAIGAAHVFDAALVRAVAPLAREATAAVLTAGDREVWYYSAATARIYYANVDELLGGVALGVRERQPGPLGSYSFSELIHDPVRARLYGLDAGAGAVVVIDAATLQPTREILVGTSPTDMDVDAAGTTLYVGDRGQQAFARIALETLTFERFVPVPRDIYQLEAMSGGRVMMIDEDLWSTPTLVNGATGAVLSVSPWSTYGGALSATADGQTVFVGESFTYGARVARYSVASGQLVKVDESDYGIFAYPPRVTTAVPDGSGVFYNGYLMSGSDLSVLRYPLADTIRAVTPDGRLALSATKVYAAADGALLGALPAAAAVLALSPDSTKAYYVSGGAVATLDLTAY